MPNHITNGVFETNTATGASQAPAGWTSTTGSPDLQTDGNFEWANSGYMPADLNASTGAGYVTMYTTATYNEGFQTTLNQSVVAGQTYTFTFDFYVNESDGTTNSPGATELLVTVGTQTVTIPIDSTGVTAPYWQTETFTFTATSTSSTFTIATNNDGDAAFTGIALDNLDLDLAPDYIVEGTAGADIIDAGYVGDPEGDQVDNLDAADGSNNDSIEAYGGNDVINAGLGNDTVLAGTGADTVDAGTGNDSVFAGDGADSIVAGDGADTVFGQVGNDTILGGAGADSLDGDGGSDSIDGGTGADTLIGDAGNDTLLGGAGNDEIYVSSGSNSIDGGADNDLIFGGSEADNIAGGTGTDTISGGSGNDAIDGGDGADRLDGADGNDTVSGGAGNDSVFGGAGDDSMSGGANNDSMEGWLGNDTIDGGTGDDYIDGADGSDSLIGGDGNDTLLGGNNGGNDTLIGGAGNDSISSGDGDESILGGTGDDIILAAGGDDEIVMENGFGNDTITGGETGEVAGDTLDLSAITEDITVDLSSANPESGTVSNATDTASFTEIENIILGSGADTLVLADGGGADTVEGFNTADSGDGTAVDQLDVSGLTSDGGTTPVNTNDVVVSDTNGDGTGDAILTFPGGESITLIGVLPSEVDSPAELQAIGVPAGPVTVHDAIVLDAIPGGTDLLTSGSEMLSVSDALSFDVATAGELNIGDTATIGGVAYTITNVYNYEADITNSGGAFPTTETAGYYILELDDGAGGTLPLMLLDDGFGDKELITEAQMLFVSPSVNGVPVAQYDSNDIVTLDIPALDYIVEGTAGDDTIDATYTGDPEGDMIDNLDHSDGSNADSVEAFGGNDSVVSGAGDDTVRGGDGADTIEGAADNDSLFGDDGNDSILGEAGNDTLEGGAGNDTLIGGDGSDSINGDMGNDSIVGGAGDDFLRGSFGEDTLIGGTGDDTLWGGFGDDSIVVDANFGNYTIDGEADAETNGDTMDVSGVTSDLTWDLSNVNPENGVFTDGTNTATFTEIENIILGSGTDTLVLSTFGGSERVTGFEAPTDTGGGTYSGNDLLDVTALTDFDGNPTHTGNVIVSDDGLGNAVLTFGNGETLTLVGVAPAEVSSPAQLIAMGIPEGPDGYVDGTAGADTIDAAYTGDPNFDLIDADDAQLPGAAPNDDYVRAGAGNDSVASGAGDDTVELGTGADTAEGGVGNDTISGEAGNDSLIGGLGDDSLLGGADDDTLNGQIGADVLDGGAGSDVFALEDDFGADTIIGGETDDATGDTLDMSGVGGALSYDLTGVDPEAGTVSDGTSTLTYSEIENVVLSSGIDTLVLDNGSGDDTVQGFQAPVDDGFGTWIGFDQVDVSTMTDANGAPVNTGDVTVSDDGSGNAVLTFPGGETLTLIGVASTAFPVPEALAAIGIPLADYIVEGTAAGEIIDSSYLGDPEGDVVDAGDGDPLLPDADSDSIEAGAGDDTVFAGAGDDTVIGDTGNDLINGQAGNDSLVGGLGTDSIAAGSGNDTVLGGEDSDTINAGSGNDSVEGGTGDDLMSGAAGADTLLGGDGDDTFAVFDGFGDDTVIGSEIAETSGDTLDLSGVSSEGVAIGYTGSESGIVTGGTTGDTVDFTEIENITATDNADTIDAALDGNGVNIDAGDGADVVTGGSGSDTIIGGAGSDTLSGGIDGDSITAGAGDDTINVAQGDTVTGGDGDDFFNIVDLGEIDTGTITITGGEGGETDGDTLALNGLHDRDSLVITDPDDVNGGLTGTVTLLDGTVVNFSNIENIICFVPGTLIATPSGLRNIEDLRVGDPVVTQDNGVQNVGWIGKSTVPACDRFAPVNFKQSMWPGSLSDLTVSPQHRMLIKGYRAELLFGQSEVLVPALHLVDGDTVTRLEQDEVTYVHIMFEQHEIIFANGIPAESFHPGAFGVDALAPQARDELFTLFPELRSDLATYGASARMALKSAEARILSEYR